MDVVGEDKVCTFLGRYIDEVSQWLETVAVVGRMVVDLLLEMKPVAGMDATTTL